MKIFIFLKNAVSPTPIAGWGLTETNFTSDGLKEVEVGLSSVLLMFCDFPIVGNFDCSVSQEKSRLFHLWCCKNQRSCNVVEAHGKLCKILNMLLWEFKTIKHLKLFSFQVPIVGQVECQANADKNGLNFSQGMLCAGGNEKGSCYVSHVKNLWVL